MDAKDWEDGYTNIKLNIVLYKTNFSKVEKILNNIKILLDRRIFVIITKKKNLEDLILLNKEIDRIIEIQKKIVVFKYGDKLSDIFELLYKYKTPGRLYKGLLNFSNITNPANNLHTETKHISYLINNTDLNKSIEDMNDQIKKNKEIINDIEKMIDAYNTTSLGINNDGVTYINTNVAFNNAIAAIQTSIVNKIDSLDDLKFNDIVSLKANYNTYGGTLETLLTSDDINKIKFKNFFNETYKKIKDTAIIYTMANHVTFVADVKALNAKYKTKMGNLTTEIDKIKNLLNTFNNYLDENSKYHYYKGNSLINSITNNINNINTDEDTIFYDGDVNSFFIEIIGIMSDMYTIAKDLDTDYNSIKVFTDKYDEYINKYTVLSKTITDGYDKVTPSMTFGAPSIPTPKYISEFANIDVYTNSCDAFNLCKIKLKYSDRVTTDTYYDLLIHFIENIKLINSEPLKSFIYKNYDQLINYFNNHSSVAAARKTLVESDDYLALYQEVNEYIKNK